MLSHTAIRDFLKNSAVDISVKGDKLRVEGCGDSALLFYIKKHKPEIIDHLTRREWLIERLRAGRVYLEEVAKRELDLNENNLVQHNLELWYQIEEDLRDILEFEGCVFGDEGCETSFPVNVCRFEGEVAYEQVKCTYCREKNG